jgi:hypothetical protein
MSLPAVTVHEWKQVNAHRLIQCRWGCRITSEACKLYQCRTGRYVIHFNGDHEPLTRANADYVRCCLPEPCPHLISDEEARDMAKERNPNFGTSRGERQTLQHAERRRNRLVDPEAMLSEDASHRSLVMR